jgi:hypothetical protein
MRHLEPELLILGSKIDCITNNISQTTATQLRGEVSKSQGGGASKKPPIRNKPKDGGRDRNRQGGNRRGEPKAGGGKHK